MHPAYYENLYITTVKKVLWHRHQLHLVDGDVLEVDGDGGLRVEEDVGVDVGGQRLGQLDELLLERTGPML